LKRHTENVAEIVRMTIDFNDIQWFARGGTQKSKDANGYTGELIREAVSRALAPERDP
jgi:hypothetical protein